jgi:hypothetical protein
MAWGAIPGDWGVDGAADRDSGLALEAAVADPPRLVASAVVDDWPAVAVRAVADNCPGLAMADGHALATSRAWVDCARKARRPASIVLLDLIPLL